MRLASFNVLHGRSLADGQVSTQRLAAACASLEADVLVLQEIDRHQVRSGNVDQTAAVAEAMGAADWRFEPALIGEPGATWRAAADGDDPAGAGSADGGPAPGSVDGGPAPGSVDGGAAPGAVDGGPAPGAVDGGPAPGSVDAGAAPGYGVGIVSRIPVRRWQVVRLRAAKVRAPVAVPGGRGRFILLPDEPRVGLAAEVDTPAGLLVVATTHLSFVPGWNLVQLRRLTAALAALNLPCVLLGDLNLPGRLPARASRWRPLANVKTFPGSKPSMQLDHALGRGLLPVVTAARAVELPLSDHQALVLDLI